MIPTLPSPDPLDEAVLSADDLSTVRTWLTTARLQCTPTVPVNPAMVAGLLAAYESAESRAVAARVVRRVATREARRERDDIGEKLTAALKALSSLRNNRACFSDRQLDVIVHQLAPEDPQ